MALGPDAGKTCSADPEVEVLDEAVLDITPQAARSVAADVFIHAFPLVLADAVRRAHGTGRCQFQLALDEPGRLAPGLADDDGSAVVTSAWIELEDEPAVLRLPHTHGRHFGLTLFDAAGNAFASLGSRTSEDSGADLALVGPHWRGQLPCGLRARRAPTDGVWAVSRIYAHSALDRPAALALAHRQCVALLRWERDLLHPAVTALPRPPTSCLRDAQDISPAQLFDRLDELLDRADPGGRGLVRRRLAELRSRLGGPPAARAWSRELSEALDRGFADGLSAIRAAAAAQAGRGVPGWRVTAGGLHDAGFDPLTQAARAFVGLGDPPREDLLTLTCERDDRGWPLAGANRYRLHFARGGLPPAQAWWRLSVCATATRDRRRGLGDRSDLALNADGSLDVFVQHAPPQVDQIGNWLATPPGEWSLTMRLYGPHPEALSGAWRMPQIERVGGRPGAGRTGPWRWSPPFGIQPRLHEARRPPPEEINP